MHALLIPASAKVFKLAPPKTPLRLSSFSLLAGRWFYPSAICLSPHFSCFYNLNIGFLPPRYLSLMRKLQRTYRMEPAGSQGVWGLDDFQFLPFIWGSSQFLGETFEAECKCSSTRCSLLTAGTDWTSERFSTGGVSGDTLSLLISKSRPKCIQQHSNSFHANQKTRVHFLSCRAN